MDLFHKIRPADAREHLITLAIAKVGASRPAVKAVRNVMSDGGARSDEEIAALCRKPSGKPWAPDTVRHARLALQEAGAIKWTGAVRKTSWGGTSCEWVWAW